MSLLTTELFEPLLSPHNPESSLCDFVTLKTDYFSYIPTPLDVSKPLLAPEGSYLKNTQNKQRNDFTSSAHSSREKDEISSNSTFDCLISPKESHLNAEDFLLRTCVSETNPIPSFDQSPTSPPNHNPIPTPTATPEPAVRKPRRKYRKRKILSQAVIEQKRDNFLKRNRVAANRYREKKKEWVTELEDRQKEQKQTNMRLIEEQERLRAEIEMLKSWLRRCTTCKGGTLDDTTVEKNG